VPRLADALEAAAGVIDVDLAGERADPVVAVLAERDVPFVFVTGYGDGVQGEYSGRPRVGKPFTRERLRRVAAGDRVGADG
jgi:hypothetical protein